MERVVKGIRQSEGSHWISAFGIIDRDNRSGQECETLHAEGIIPLVQYSVESLYYHPQIVRSILERVAMVNDIDPTSTYEEIVKSFVKSIEPHKERLAARFVQRKVKELLSRKAPDWREILAGGVKVGFSSDNILNEELQLIEELVQDRDVEKLISRYPIRETPALEMIARGALFPSQEKYEQAVRKMLIEGGRGQGDLKQILGPVTNLVLGAKQTSLPE